MLDLAGLGLIAPYIGFVVQPDSATYGRLGELLNFFDWNMNRERLLLWLSGLIVVLFLGKAIAALGINNLIIRFAQNQQVRLALPVDARLPAASLLDLHATKFC